MKRFLLIAATIFLLFGMTSCKSNTDKSLDRVLSRNKIVVGLDFDLYPLIIENSEDGLKGFTADYVDELSGRLGVSVKYVDVKEAEFPLKLSENDIDCFINLTNPSRSQKTDFYLIESMVYHKQSAAVATSSGIESLADLNGKKVGVVRNSYASKTLKKAKVLSSSLEKVDYCKNNDELLKNLSNGAFDAAVIDNVELSYSVKKNSDFKLKMLKNAVATDCYYFCFERSDVALKDKVNGIVESMFSDGTIKSLSEKWFGIDLTEIENNE